MYMYTMTVCICPQVLLSLTTTPAFKSFLDTIQSRPLLSGSSLDALLIAPLKRISTYIQDLQELKAHTPTEHVDYQVMADTITELESIQKVLSLMQVCCIMMGLLYRL